jgi:hypothetical protein
MASPDTVKRQRDMQDEAAAAASPRAAYFMLAT